MIQLPDSYEIFIGAHFPISKRNFWLEVAEPVVVWVVLLQLYIC